MTEEFEIKSGYQPRLQPNYYREESSEIVWQHQIYTLAIYIARHLHCKYLIDIGCGNWEKLRIFQHEFEIGLKSIWNSPTCTPISVLNFCRKV
jgi:hypothetical protein